MKTGVVTLRSLELAGFKSFAKRTKLEFGEGLVAIVGPNGSGKSNVVDAIRWVFGEQKNKSLRTDKAEELIYHGGDGKAQASMAEVVITLDNSSGRIPVELPEIEITRRLYRSGESNYLLNGKKVSLSSILELLAKSGFGVGSYTIVGQGLIEKLILATGQERKVLFEEASGIKQFEIKQAQTQKRLESTKQNLAQINSMIAELAPQQEALAKQAGLVAKRKKLSGELRDLRHNHLSFITNEANVTKQQLQHDYNVSNSELAKLQAGLIKLEKDHRNHSKSTGKSSAGDLSKKLNLLESQRHSLEGEITQATVELEQANLQKLADAETLNILQTQIKSAKNNLKLHHKQQRFVQNQITKYDDKIAIIDKKVQSQTKLLDKARLELSKTQKTEYLQHSLGLIDILQASIEAGKSTDQLAVIFYKLRRMIRHSIVDDPAELALKVGRIQNSISALLDEREKLTESQTNEVIRLRASEMDEATVTNSLSEFNRRLKPLQTSTSTLKLSNNNGTVERLQKLEVKKTNLLSEISQTQRLLAELANQTSIKTDTSYFTQHEETAGQILVLKQKVAQYQQGLAGSKESLEGAEQLRRNWYGNELFKLIRKPRNVQLDTIRAIEAELNLLNEISPEVEKDYSESAKRMEFLTSQSKDLQKALGNLDSVFAKTEQEMQKTFKVGFAKINQHFGQSFKKLFGGGEAKLLLADEDTGYGIEIIVQLPSKRAQNLSSLSGGEKALASAALLAGILAANPSPFVVLDEVDAALDENNTKKFADLLTTISTHSQVLVVTHNHDTMATADELLGVTTAGNNESHIVRVRLDSLPVGMAN